MSASVIVVVLLLAITIDAAPKPNYGLASKYNNNEDVGILLIERKPLRNFDILKLGGGFGLAKRYDDGEKHRRGPLNGLIPGGAFGRAARNQKYDESTLNYEKIRKFMDGLEENRIDGQSIDRNSIQFDTTNHVDCE